MNKLRAALFDVDGVLLDSLKPHLKICEDKSKEYGLGLKIPSALEFKAMARRGTQISPMKYFFAAVGFPEEYAEKAELQYQKIFAEIYAPAPFPGVHETLKALREVGLQMGIVTSNVKANIVKALGRSIDFFCPECIYSKDNSAGMSKSQAIASAMTKLQARPAETIYVGDQLADWEAAKAIPVDFLGVAYGWGISEEDKDFPTVKEVSGIYRYISGRANFTS
jgi:phosphoglycolate phosphatase-like HAD superfamily hydrolase